MLDVLINISRRSGEYFNRYLFTELRSKTSWADLRPGLSLNRGLDADSVDRF